MNTFITYLDNFCEIIEVNFESYDNFFLKIKLSYDPFTKRGVLTA